MKYNKKTASVFEVTKGVFVGDLEGENRWIATIPRRGLPKQHIGRSMDVRGPAIEFPMRDMERWNYQMDTGCEASDIARMQQIDEVQDDPSRRMIHYRLIFPCRIDHTMFRTGDDDENEVHLSETGLTIPGQKDVKNPDFVAGENTWTDSAMTFMMAHWRVSKAKAPATRIGKTERKVSGDKFRSKRRAR